MMLKKSYLMMGAFCCTIAVIGAETDKSNAGGAGVDSAKSQSAQVAPQSENLLKFSDFEDPKVDLKQNAMGNWGGSIHAHVANDEGLDAKLEPYSSRQISTDKPASGSRCAALITPLTINKFRNAAGEPMISNRISQSITLPESSVPVKYLLTFKVRGTLEKTPGFNSFRAFVFFFDSTEPWGGKEIKEMLNVEFPLKPDWQNNSLSFIAPAGTRSLLISLALYGCGETYLDDVELRQTPAEKGITN